MEKNGHDKVERKVVFDEQGICKRERRLAPMCQIYGGLHDGRRTRQLHSRSLPSVSGKRQEGGKQSPPGKTAELMRNHVN